jgi:hypothetical protein
MFNDILRFLRGTGTYIKDIFHVKVPFLGRAKSAQDPDPHGGKKLDPFPVETNADPQH